MTESNLARMLLDHLRRMPNATPAKLLAEFRSLLADDRPGVRHDRQRR